MSDEDRDAFLMERRVGVLAIGRAGKGPLLAPIWYQYTPGGMIDICMGGSTVKAARLRAEGEASVCVQDEARPYRYVTVEGHATVESLGDTARERVTSMAKRYLGEQAGQHYCDAFSTPDEVIVRITPRHWHTEVLG